MIANSDERFKVMAKKRRPAGGTIGLVAMLALVLALLAVFVVFLVKLLGGGEQMQRATDSGNLTLTRAELDQFTVPIPSSGAELQFNGASDHTTGGNGVINLRNINSVMGQSFLVNMNASAIAAQGLDNGATANAGITNTAAQSIATGLSTAMSNASAAYNSFNSAQLKNPTAEYGNAANTSAGAPQFSYVDRGQPSNIYIDPHQLADYNFTTGTSATYTNAISALTATVSSATDAGQNHYLLGYTNGITPGASFPSTYFVPLRPGARPHLVSRATFVSNQSPKLNSPAFNWNTPVGNAVSQATLKSDAETGMGTFAAYGQVQPIDPAGVGLAIKHGFIRVKNGAPSPASGFANGNSQDVFVFTMNNPQYYATDSTGKALPYFVGVNDAIPGGASSWSQYVQNQGSSLNCNPFSVGYALSGDKVGAGGVSQSNCSQIAGVAGPIDNIALSTPSSSGNVAMAPYDSTPLQPDPLGYSARPVIEAAYNIAPAQATGSNGASVSVGDLVNLAMLSARATGANFTLKGGAYNSGIAYIPPNRGALASPNFKIAQQPEGANMTSYVKTGSSIEGPEYQGIQRFGTVWNFLAQRFYEIDPTWTTYCTWGATAHPSSQPGNVDTILSQATVPMAGTGIIYYSQSGNGGKGGLVFKEQSAAIADAPWLANFINQTPDGKAPVNPSEISEFPLVAEGGTGGDAPQGMIDVDGDWGFPHPYDNPPSISIMNWYQVTQSSGYNNLLGEINLGAVNTTGQSSNNCPATAASYTINAGAGASGSDTMSLPAGGTCGGTTTGGGPC
jgi:hypothetical protein